MADFCLSSGNAYCQEVFVENTEIFVWNRIGDFQVIADEMVECDLEEKSEDLVGDEVQATIIDTVYRFVY